MFEGTPFQTDPVETNRTDARAAYLDMAMHSGDIYFAIDALGAISNALGMADVARKVGLPESVLREEFSTNRISAVTFLRVLAAVGLDFRPVPLAA